MPTSSSRSFEAQPAARSLTRRRLAGLAAVALTAGLGGCGERPVGQAVDISGSSPALAFAMIRAADGKPVTPADYRGRVVMLFIGYTFCPDICPTTLANITNILTRLGGEAREVAVLFVTVDPDRDTRTVLADYVNSFAPQIEGLRGTPDQLASLARRYRLVYSVTPASDGQPYEVTHSSGVYVFDRTGAARLLVPSLASTAPDIDGTAANLRRLVAEHGQAGVWSRILRMV